MKKYLIFICLCLQIPIHSQQRQAWLAKPQYDEIGTFHEGVAAMKSNGLWGYINEDGTVLVAPEYDIAFDFSDGVGILTAADYTLKAIADKSGKLVNLPESYIVDNRFAYFSEGLLPVKKRSGEWGYLSRDGVISIPCKYRVAFPFSEGMAAVQLKEWNWGYIDKTGAIAVRSNLFNKTNAVYWPMAFTNGQSVVLLKNGIVKMDLNGIESPAGIKMKSSAWKISTDKYVILSEDGGRLIIDRYGKAIRFVESDGEEILFREEEQPVPVKPGISSTLIFSGKEIAYESPEIRWINAGTAVIKGNNNKYGMINLRGSKLFDISLASDTIRTKELKTASKLLLANPTNYPLKQLDILAGTKNHPAGFSAKEFSGEISVPFSKNTEEFENISIMLSISEYGLLLQEETMLQPMIGIPEMEVSLLRKSFEVKEIVEAGGKKIEGTKEGPKKEIPPVRIEFAVKNTGNIDLPELNVTVRENANGKPLFNKNISLPNHSDSEKLSFSLSVSASGSRSLEIKLQPKYSPPVVVKENVQIRVIEADVNTSLPSPKSGSGKQIETQ